MNSFAIPLALAGLIFGAASAKAAGEVERLYTVYGVAEDETAKTAAEARGIAIEKAENEAFRRLVHKLAAEGDAPPIALPEGASAADYVLGFEVVEEKNSRVRYIGKIDVSFDPHKMAALFGAAGAPYVAIPAAPVLVLPVLQQDGAALLWEDENLFRAAWANADIKNRLVDYRLPAGTLEERTAVTPEQVLSGRQRERLRELASRYGASEVWAALATIERNTFGDPVSLHVQMAPLAGGGEAKTWTFAPAFGENEAALFSRAIGDILADQDRDWKRLVLAGAGEVQDITVGVAVRSEAEWASIVADLKQVAVVREVRPAILALPESELALRFQGTIEQLRLALAQKGLMLFASSRGYSVARQAEPAGDGAPE
jgi:Uncharacterized protein conserved in bacteria (DUF2066)